MGQKVNPNGLRLGINKDWNAKWYADKKDFSSLLSKDIKIRKYLEKKLSNAGIANVEIERSKDKTEVVIHTSKPGVMIGSGGEEIEKLTKALSKLVDENVRISIADIKKVDLNAQLVADSIANQITNRASFRMAQKRAIRNTMRAGAKGIKTQVSGRLGGADIARSEGYKEGVIPLHTLRADVDYAVSEADTTFGKIGVKVWIYKGEILNKKGNKSESLKVEDKKEKKATSRDKKVEKSDEPKSKGGN